MNPIYAFRLTKKLYEEIKNGDDNFASVLGAWNEEDYDNLCEYVVKCNRVVPKYIGMLASLLGESPRSVIRQIVEAKGSSMEGMDSLRQSMMESSYMTFIPEDCVDTELYVRSYCGTVAPAE